MIVTLGDTITTPKHGREKAIIRTVTRVGVAEFDYRVWQNKKRCYLYRTIKSAKAPLVFGNFIQRQGVQLKNLLKEKIAKAEAKEQREANEKQRREIEANF
jgi:hypothetical protein